ncbi:MAG: GNAT superfamily N-acetyltransferase [Lentisphaeria bacterium]|jgi:GNAT superfamily N-acetyltransferase
MTIRTIRVDYTDKKQLSDLVSMLIVYSADAMGGGQALSCNLAQKAVRELAKRAYAFSFLCYDDEQAVGFANCFESMLTFTAKPVINIHDLAVIQEYRGQRLSYNLLQAVEEFGLSKQAYKVTLEVLEGNIPARIAYEKFGFAGYELDPQFGKALFWQKIIDL